MWFDAFTTPIGTLTIAGDEAGLRHVLFPQNKYGVDGRTDWRRDAAPLREVRTQLEDYFEGTRRVFELALAPTGTVFQRKVWHGLATIPIGSTWSYGQLARHIDEPTAVRAVGAANGRNPLPIILPCHRVIGSDGKLTGFGGGLPLKQWLLVHEGVGQAGLGF
jgi:methylated-DNA-[protein]-cysteine S-methyltransferase